MKIISNCPGLGQASFALFLTAALTLPASASLKRDLDLNCQSSLTSTLDITTETTLPLLNDVGARSLQKRIDSYSGEMNGEKIVVKVAQLNGIYLTGGEVQRDGREIGLLGRTLRGRHLLLQAAGSDSTTELARVHRLNTLAKVGLAVPYWGLTRIKGRDYWARPLVAGHLPFLSLQPDRYAVASQIDDLHRLRSELKSLDPFFAEGVLYTPKLIAERSIDTSTMTLNEEEITEWRNFMQPLAFVASADGRLLLENPASTPNVAPGYMVTRAPEKISWPLNRWSGYAYLLLTKMPDVERAEAAKQMRQVGDQKKTVNSIQNLWDLTTLNDILTRSPDWRAFTFELSGGPQTTILDLDHPHPRPANLAFKNKDKLKYHAKKHAAEFGLSSAEEYLRSAIDFIHAAPKGDRQYFVRGDGHIVLFEPDTTTFAVFSPDGMLLTYMRPSTKFNGHSFDGLYFLEQFAKGTGFFRIDQ